VRLIETAAAIAEANVRGDLAHARRLAAELPAPPAAAEDAHALVAALVAALHDRSDPVPPAIEVLARNTLTMAELARELAAPDLSAPRVPTWLPWAGAVFVLSAMALAVYVGRHSLGFIDPEPDCKPPPAAVVSAIRFDDTCRVLSWQPDTNTTWIIQRDADGTPVLATRSTPQAVRVLDLDEDGDVIARGTVPPAELAALKAELAVMLPSPP
jgi:hypothetical protein